MQSFWFLDTLADINIDAADTGGAYALVTITAPAGHMPPPHIHANEDEGFVVLEGELTVHTSDGSKVLQAGDGAHAPRGEVHTVEVTGDKPCRVLVISQPGGFASFIRAVGTPAERHELPTPDGPPDIDRLTRIAAEHGVTFVGPPGSRPADLAAAETA